MRAAAVFQHMDFSIRVASMLHAAECIGNSCVLSDHPNLLGPAFTKETSKTDLQRQLLNSSSNADQKAGSSTGLIQLQDLNCRSFPLRWLKKVPYHPKVMDQMQLTILQVVFECETLGQ